MTEKAKETPKAAVPEIKKRGQYKRIECPHCHTFVGNLANHMKLKHPTAAKTEPETLTKEDLLGTPGDKEEEPEIKGAKQVYRCSNCQEAVRKGENPCWKCGAVLNWEGIA